MGDAAPETKPVETPEGQTNTVGRYQHQATEPARPFVVARRPNPAARRPGSGGDPLAFPAVRFKIGSKR